MRPSFERAGRTTPGSDPLCAVRPTLRWKAAIRQLLTPDWLRPGQVALALAILVALAIAPAVRGTTAELEGMLGGAWPFSMRHALKAPTPASVPRGQTRSGVPTR